MKNEKKKVNDLELVKRLGNIIQKKKKRIFNLKVNYNISINLNGITCYGILSKTYEAIYWNM